MKAMLRKPTNLIHKAVLLFRKRKSSLFQNNQQPIEAHGLSKVMYRIRFGNIQITQDYLGKASTVNLPIEQFHALSKEVKKVRRKERKKKQKS